MSQITMLNHLKQHFGSRRTTARVNLKVNIPTGVLLARHIAATPLLAGDRRHDIRIDHAQPSQTTLWFPAHRRSRRPRHCAAYRLDPGNWAFGFGYALLWIVTLSTIMLIVLQHNAAHLGIATGACLAEATTRYLPRFVGRTVLASAYLATIATAMAEVLGGAIALQMLFGLPVRAGCVIVAAASIAMLMTSSYKRAERWIIAFVGVVGLSFLAELALVKVDWPQAATSWITPSMPTGSAAIIVSVLGAVVMPHNLFLHSEVIQSMHFEGQGEQVIEERLRYELFDTLFSMGVGWAINSAMVILAATTFFAHGIVVDDLAVAAATLSPILGPASSIIFAVALLFAGISSSVTAGMAAGTITAGMFDEEYDIHDRHSSIGVAACFVGAVAACLVVPNPFEGLIWSQALLSLQLPITVFVLIRLTSSPRVMGKYANSRPLNALLVGIGVIVTILDVVLLTGM